MMASNPWQVDSIDEFYFLKCPECMFFSQEENDFKGHAIENHPLSNTLFGNLGAKYLFFSSLVTSKRDKDILVLLSLYIF